MNICANCFARYTMVRREEREMIVKDGALTMGRHLYECSKCGYREFERAISFEWPEDEGLELGVEFKFK